MQKTFITLLMMLTGSFCLKAQSISFPTPKDTPADYKLNLLIGNSSAIRKMEIGGFLNVVKGDVRYFEAAGFANCVGGSMKGFQAAGFSNVVGWNSDGFQAAGFGNIVKGTVNGFQASGFGNIAGSNVKGFQAAGFGNMVKGNKEGFMAAGFGNMVGGDVKGFQAAGFMNINGGKVDAFQAAGFINLNRKDTKGSQFAGFCNLTPNMKGMHAAGGFNYVDSSASKFQAAGIFNFARRMQGLQIAGLFNYASVIKGLQVAPFNFADSCTGMQLGVLSFVRHGGYTKLEISADEIFFANASLRTGVKAFHNIISVGIRPEDVRTPFWTFGYGAGTTATLSHKLDLDIDVSGHQILNYGFRQTWYQGTDCRLNVGVDWHFAKKASLAIGPVLHLYLFNTKNQDFINGFDKIHVGSYLYNQTVGYDNGTNIRALVGGKVAIRFL